jgi:Ca2+/H+ antiporter, TMEM165/GDT1 family
MTVLSAAFGLVFLKFIPPAITRWVSVALFAIFGLKMLYEGWRMSPADATEEMNEVQTDISRRENSVR